MLTPSMSIDSQSQAIAFENDLKFLKMTFLTEKLNN